MLWTQRKVRRVIERAKQAREKIESLFLADVTSQAGDKWAWGQFFHDTREHKQYGIYGTSAGTQVLLMAGYGSENKYVLGARKLLEEAYTSSSDDNRFHKDHHFDRVYKLTFLIEAQSTDQDRVEEPTAAIEDLITRILPEQGWGEFCNSESDKDVESRIASTAASLLAISKYRRFRATSECEKAVAWLCRRLREKANPAIYQLALGSLAVTEYQSLRDRVAEYDAAKEFAKKQLIKWARKRKSELLGSDESHHYPTSSDGSRGNRYLFFLPDCLAALAFLKWESPKRARRYVLNVANFFAKEVIEKNGFLSVSRNHACTVDHLWIYRLLREVESKEVRDLLPQPYYVWSNMPFSAKILTSLGFLIVGCIGLYYTLLAREPGQHIPVWQLVIFGVMASVGLAMFTGNLREHFRGED